MYSYYSTYEYINSLSRSMPNDVIFGERKIFEDAERAEKWTFSQTPWVPTFMTFYGKYCREEWQDRFTSSIVYILATCTWRMYTFTSI